MHRKNYPNIHYHIQRFQGLRQYVFRIIDHIVVFTNEEIIFYLHKIGYLFSPGSKPLWYFSEGLYNISRSDSQDRDLSRLCSLVCSIPIRTWESWYENQMVGTTFYQIQSLKKAFKKKKTIILDPTVKFLFQSGTYVTSLEKMKVLGTLSASQDLSLQNVRATIQSYVGLNIKYESLYQCYLSSYEEFISKKPNNLFTVKAIRQVQQALSTVVKGNVQMDHIPEHTVGPFGRSGSICE